MIPDDIPTVDKRFFQPLMDAYDACRLTRSCPEYSDLDHALCGIGRVIENVQSGRDWIQAASARGMNASVSRFFDSLASAARLERIEEIASRVEAAARESAQPSHDPLGGHSELDGFELYADDGHTLGACPHEDEIEGKVRPRTHVFSLCLRSHALRHLALCKPAPGMKKENELKTLKRLPAKALRMGARAGVRVLHAYDPAIVDYPEWMGWKRDGVYIVTREKSNSALQLKRALAWDAADPRNNGVVFDEVADRGDGIEIRRISYQDPATGADYSFLTTEMTLPPGAIVFVYKLRWDIEKVFDQSKNGFVERRGWAKSEPAKKQHGHFISMAHNLCVIFERLVEKEEGVVDRKSLDKREARRSEEMAKAEAGGRPFNSLVAQCRRITKRSLQFLRWLRHSLWVREPWKDAIARLKPLMLKYIT